MEKRKHKYKNIRNTKGITESNLMSPYDDDDDGDVK